MTRRRVIPTGQSKHAARVRVRRPEILASTVALAREQGLSNVRVADVARRAGTSPTGVIYYFASKDQLFEQVVAEADTSFYAALRPELARLESGIDRLAWLAVRASHSEWPLWMDTWLLARRNPEMRAAEQGFENRWCEIIAETIRHGRERNEFRCLDAEEVALRLAAITEGLAVHMVLEHPGRTREHFVSMSLKAAALELGCDEAALTQAAARVPVPNHEPSSTPEGTP